MNLLPCPFCGGEAELVHDNDEPEERWHWVECQSCMISTHTTENPQIAIAQWNRRT